MNLERTKKKLKALSKEDLKRLELAVSLEKERRGLNEARGVGYSTYGGGARELSGFFSNSFDKHHGGCCMFEED